ncbi:MAG TPA: TIGR00725 family protein [Actinomycetota bacterium]
MGAADADHDLAQQAYEVGAELARAGAILVNGGRGGVMEAAAKGASEAGGTTVAILPGADRRRANAYSDIVIPTDMGEARNVLIVRTADALIALGGEFGTLSEIAFALKIGKPVVSFGSWDLERAGAPAGTLIVADSPKAAAEAALRASGRAG